MINEYKIGDCFEHASHPGYIIQIIKLNSDDTYCVKIIRSIFPNLPVGSFHGTTMCSDYWNKYLPINCPKYLK